MIPNEQTQPDFMLHTLYLLALVPFLHKKTLKINH